MDVDESLLPKYRKKTLTELVREALKNQNPDEFKGVELLFLFIKERINFIDFVMAKDLEKYCKDKFVKVFKLQG